MALVDRDGTLAAEVTLRSRESHAERILPAVQWALATLGSSPAAVAAVAVSSGPGSFTGLRAGIASAKGLAFSLGVPLYGFPTLDALAANLPPGEGAACAVLNARRGEVYRAHFKLGPTGAERTGPDALVANGALAAELPDGCLVFGDLAGLPAMPGRRLRFASGLSGHPRAAAVALLGTQALAAARPTEIATLAPRYLRAFDGGPMPGCPRQISALTGGCKPAAR